MEQMATIGLDIAKSVFQVHGIGKSGSVVVQRRLRRSQVLGFFSKLSPCVVGIEACASSHFWAREINSPEYTQMIAEIDRRIGAIPLYP